MTETKLKLKVTQTDQSTKKHNELELIITPKKEVLEWFNSTKGIIKKIEVDNRKSNLNKMECPNCKYPMINHKPKNDPRELWHICTKCKISFTQSQHRYFTQMIKRLINEDTTTL